MKNILITGGGTGGHLSIAKAVKEELNKRGVKPIFVGSSYGQDLDWFKDDDGFLEKYFFDTTTVVNKKYFSKILSLKDILYSSLRCKDIFKKHKIDVVFSVGGYAAAPASFASVFFRKKFYIHEQNAVMGSLHKLLKSKANAIFSSYYKDSPVKDYPVRDVFFENRRVRKDIKTVIFLGGSQGAVAINNFAKQLTPLLKKKGIKVIHQSGKRDFQSLKNYYKELDIDVDLFEFSNNLEDKIKKADFAISRAGASTLWELTATGLPALFIPYPYAASDHQYYNAKYLSDQGLALVKRENELDISVLDDILDLDLRSVSEKLGNLIKPSCVKEIVDFILFR